MGIDSWDRDKIGFQTLIKKGVLIMKAHSFENWLNNTIETPFLFFVQSMEEMLFPYGHDSYKVPTLNFHFLCIEILSSIEKIEADIIDKGNMRPMFDELSSVFENDYVARKLYGTDFYSLFYNKNDKGEYNRDCAQLNKDPGSEISLKIIRKTLLFLIDDMEIEDKYLNTLKVEIEQLLQKTILNIKDSEKLSNLSRLLLTELINRGYSQEYIYAQIKERYYSCENEIKDVSEEINLFWEMFSFKECKYNVVLPIKRADIKKLLDHFQNITVTENEQELFGNSCRWVAEIEINSLDPESARIEASSLISLFVSLKQYNSHISKAYYANRAIVKEIELGKEYNLSKPATLLSRGRTRTEEQTYARIGKMIQNFPVIGGKMINAINLHSSAMESRNVSNQLLNLWTIVEVLIEIDKHYSYSKIVQISNTLTTVLNSSYIKSLIEQLIFDLEHCCVDFDNRLENITKGNTKVEKMVAMLVLPEFDQNKTDLVNALINYPLLQYRIQHYSERFSNRSELKKVLSNHRKRLEWQIMRIYRNRNMIVHDGSHFPYIDLIVQNLHFYIDALMDTINFYVGKGYTSLEVIYALLNRKEFEYQIILEKKDNNKNPLSINADFVTTVLGNAYVE